MSRKEIVRLVEYLEPQGVRTTRTTKGLLLRLPNDTTTMLHFSGSDHRERDIVRSRIKRAGLDWPGEPSPLGEAITEHRPHRKTLERVQRALDGYEQRYITGSQLRRIIAQQDGTADRMDGLGVVGNVQAQRALYHLGWIPTGKSTARKWMRPLEAEPEPVFDEPQPEPEAELPAAVAEWSGWEPLQPAPEPAPHPDAAQPGSWAMELEHLPNDTTIEQLWVYIQALGLQGEVRVWRHG